MPSPDERNANTVVIEMAPGWIYVKIAEPKPEPGRIDLLLGLTIKHWFISHPHFVIDKTLALTDHWTLHGINVWYHVDDRQGVPVNPEFPSLAAKLEEPKLARRAQPDAAAPAVDREPETRPFQTAEAQEWEARGIRSPRLEHDNALI
jgi:hypothetical protein